jgi:spermidine/putrescine transport system substrate-binding protein
MKFKNYLLAIIVSMASMSGVAHAGGDLFIYNWTDYTPPELIKKFEAETGIKVTVDTFDSNETLLAKLKAGGGGYDIVVATNNWINVFAKDKLIQPIDASKMLGYENIDTRWKSPSWDPKNTYSIPYVWGFTSFAVNTKVYSGDINTLKVLFNPPSELKGKLGMINSPSEAVQLTQTYLGMDYCQSDSAAMKRVQDVLVAQAPAVKVYNSDGTVERLSSGEVAMHMMWNGNAMRARLANPDIKMAFPKEGVVAWMDNVAVPTSAKNPENAKKFVQFLLKPENIAMVSNFAGYANGIPASKNFLNKDMANAPELTLPKGINAKFLITCDGASTKLVDRVWTKVKR